MASEAVPAHLRQATAATPRVVRPCGAVRRIDIRVANTCGPQTATASSTWCRRGHRNRCGCRGRRLGGCHNGSRGRRNFCRRRGRGSRRRAGGSKGRLGFRLRLGLGLGLGRRCAADVGASGRQDEGAAPAPGARRHGLGVCDRVGALEPCAAALGLADDATRRRIGAIRSPGAAAAAAHEVLAILEGLARSRSAQVLVLLS
mmetsp:Transcript_17678/g.61933  ORF Transcript_17678/g.61933 Transcript_17678/m.61933 type:complete len:202 (-) Transcript_17678:22-627(-)